MGKLTDITDKDLDKLNSTQLHKKSFKMVEKQKDQTGPFQEFFEEVFGVKCNYIPEDFMIRGEYKKDGKIFAEYECRSRAMSHLWKIGSDNSVMDGGYEGSAYFVIRGVHISLCDESKVYREHFLGGQNYFEVEKECVYRGLDQRVETIKKQIKSLEEQIKSLEESKVTVKPYLEKLVEASTKKH